MAATGSVFVMISYYSFWSTLEMAVAPHIQLSQHPTTSPSITLPKMQLLLLGTSPKVYIVIMQCQFKKCVAEIRGCSQTLECTIN